MSTAPDKISLLMAKLNCTYAEAVEVAKADDEIDHGAKLFELDEELKAGAKKARNAPHGYTFTQRERKEDTDKRTLITLLAEAVGECEITNPEREIAFIYNDRKFKITLSAPRT